MSASGLAAPMNLRACSVVQRSYFVFVISDSCDGQAHHKHPVLFSVAFFNPPGVPWAQSSYLCGMCWWALWRKTYFPGFPVSSFSHWAMWTENFMDLLH